MLTDRHKNLHCCKINKPFTYSVNLKVNTLKNKANKKLKKIKMVFKEYKKHNTEKYKTKK